jgi:nucleoside-diphosphate-sugar epimerase
LKLETSNCQLLLAGHGYLGRAVADAFRRAGWDVSALSLGGPPAGERGCGAPPGSVTAGASGALTELACDIAEPAAVAALARRLPRPACIVHCAASGRGGPDAYRRVYLGGCRNMLECFPGVPLLFTSSTSVYAQSDGSEVSEDSPAEPAGETGPLLLETERLVLAGGGIVCRLAGIYGPGRSVILQRFLTGTAVVEEDGRRFLNQIHRDDAAAALHHLATSAHPHRLYNVVDSRPLAQRDCYAALAEMFGLPEPPQGPRNPHRKRGWTHKRVSNARLRATGWEPRFACFLDAAREVAATL